MNTNEKSKTKLFQDIDESFQYAVVYTEVTIRGLYSEIFRKYGSDCIKLKNSREKRRYVNANFFKLRNEAKENMSVLKSITNRKYTNVHIIKR
jgi:hypothetical protein